MKFILIVKGHVGIIVIGAGASGIAAATKLLSNGFTNVTILEAADDIGGRIKTIKMGANVVDLGAQWFVFSISLFFTNFNGFFRRLFFN